ncbi:nucleic acid-binding protein [Cyanothece sp. BG0011]|uniref:nucleic acid-binding protein n=1 Tax=Cyanothece sp. BG0011 TaxID=2082950 RepID=UPI000D1DF25D|nr:nucleic acid-binding protein [Cyanothece sp. BG0011]
MIIFIDTGVLGILSSPNKRKEVIKSQEWLYSCLSRGFNLVSSDICDYEVRRGLLLGGESKIQKQGLNNLDELHNLINFLLVNPIILRYAAELWAETRRLGIPTAEIDNIDVDIIIGATCQLLQQEYPGQRVVIATTNVKHLSRFIEAQKWTEII